MENLVYKSLANLLANRAISWTHPNSQKYTGEKKGVFVEFNGVYRKNIPNEIYEKLQEYEDEWISAYNFDRKGENVEGLHQKYLMFLNQVNDEYAEKEVTYNCHWDGIDLKKLFSIKELKKEIIKSFKSVGWDDDLGCYDTMNPKFDLEKNQIIFRIIKYK